MRKATDEKHILNGGITVGGRFEAALSRLDLGTRVVVGGEAKN